MNRITVCIVLTASCMLLACGNKGDLFLETDPAITKEIQLLDESLDELEEEPATGSETESVTPDDANTGAKSQAEIEAAIKKAKKKANSNLTAE